ncbi:hypothetical protein PC114_g14552 [Phytophthora cactorum]|nr:hypothetical protein PC114_g14552 [Phytophthora cactorum]KAG4041300.1 hypothetical protein PC123_g23183 [Phytophthora cactorum]
MYLHLGPVREEDIVPIQLRAITILASEGETQLTVPLRQKGLFPGRTPIETGLLDPEANLLDDTIFPRSSLT